MHHWNSLKQVEGGALPVTFRGQLPSSVVFVDQLQLDHVRDTGLTPMKTFTQLLTPQLEE